MKKAIVKYTSPMLAILVLLSTFSWKVDKHICMGRVMDIAFFSSASSCELEGLMSDMHKETMQKLSCCDDESFTVAGQNELKKDLTNFDLDFPVISVIPDQFLSLPLQNFDPNKIEEIFPPPLIYEDYTIFFEVFLI